MQTFWLIGFILFLPFDIVLAQVSELVHAFVFGASIVYLFFCPLTSFR